MKLKEHRREICLPLSTWNNADETHIVEESQKETLMAVFCIVFFNSEVGPGLIYRFARK